jgi:putative transposase
MRRTRVADTIQNICGKHAVSEQSFYRWRQRFGGMNVPDAVHLRELERENARLKKLVAERDLEIEVMKEILRGGSWLNSALAQLG